MRFSMGMDDITEGRTDTMADELRMALLELLRKAELEEDADFLRDRRAGLPAARAECRARYR